MAMFTLYIIVLLIITGLVLTKPIEEKASDETKSADTSIDQGLQQAAMVLNRYSHVMTSDEDQLVHAMFVVLMKNPISFSFIPHHALDIALKNMAQKLGQLDVDILTKPLLSSIEQNALKKSKQLSSYQLTDDVKSQIEDALDKFFQDQEDTSFM